MREPDWRNLALGEGILRESISEADRIVLWLPENGEQGLRYWERISTMPRAEIIVEDGICATAAQSVQARQPTGGFLGRLVKRFSGSPGTQVWTLPNGKSAEQCGERQNDLILAWSENDASELDEPRIKAHWPQCNRIQLLGTNLFLVAGVPLADGASFNEQPQGQPRDHAERVLAAARTGGDRRKEAIALTDLAVAHMRESDYQNALPLLEEALSISRELSDKSMEMDVMGNLGTATLFLGQAQRALEFLAAELSHVRAARDRVMEKQVLGQIGLAYAALGDSRQALSYFEAAAVLAHEFGDQQHEADLHWYRAIQLAELGQPDQALASAEATVELLGKMKKPQAAWFAEHLHRYRIGAMKTGGTGANAGRLVAPPPSFAGGAIVASGWGPAPGPGGGGEQTPSGPGLLRMAVSATKAMAQFIASGLKTLPPHIQQKRLRICTTCEYHTGLRCKVCGCFTNAKARLAHERCPIGKWPAQP